MRTLLACAAPYGKGGLGQHLAQLIERARAEGSLDKYYCLSPRHGDTAGVEISPKSLAWVLNWSPVRLRPDWRTGASAEVFDRAVASRLEKGDVFVGFSGQSLQTFTAARRLGYSRLELESPTGHIRAVLRLQRLAEAAGIERGWVGRRLLRRMLVEYALADQINVTTSYAFETFVAEGVPTEKLSQRSLVVDPRFVSIDRERSDHVFRVLYVGALTVMKGIHVLLDAFDQLRNGNASLTLVGGWTTRSMRRWIQARVERDPRICIATGDPLPFLREADVYVHPSFHDGFGLAPMEALACGVPVIITEDTGMREHVQEGVNGFVVPTGDSSAIVQRLEYLRLLGRPLIDPLDTSRFTPIPQESE